MDISSPYAAVLSPAEGPILAVLVGTTKPLSGREIARISGVSVNGAWKALRRLADHGVVKEEPVGNVTLYTLNRDHLAADAIAALTRLRSTLIERLGELIVSWEIQPVNASMFGSTARGDGDTTRDIDLFVVRPSGVDEDDAQWRSQIDAVADAVLAWTGNHASIAEIPEADVARLRRERPPVVEELVKDGITLVGESTANILRKPR